MKSIDKIIDLGSVFFSVSRETLVSRRKDNPVALVRFSIMGALREEGHTLEAIGDAFGRDDSTARHAISKLTPEAMAKFWPNHLRFLAAIKLRADFEDDPIPDVITVTRMAIADIDQKVDAWLATRRILVGTLAALEATELKA